MNTLTQQQINQYQWHVADGVARVSDESLHYVYSTTKRHEVERYLLYTNAPNGTYSGDAFELMWQYYDDNDGWNEWLISTQPERDRANGYQLRLFLRLKPSHLPAVLTTQPGEEWKDRYEEVWMFQFTDDYGYDLWEQIRVDYSETNYDELVKMYAKNNVSVKREWHPITPPAEQQAETVNPNIEHLLNIERLYNQLQSTLTIKDQRIAELEGDNELHSLRIQYLEERINDIADWMYNSIPTGNVNAWDCIVLLNKTYKKLSSLPTPPQH
jgi:hypothetical protein